MAYSQLIIKIAIVGISTLLFTACNSSSPNSAIETKKNAVSSNAQQTVDSAENQASPASSATAENQASLATEATAEQAKQTELANVISKPGKVKNRGGYVKLLVNRQPITNFDVVRRTKFLKLRRVSGNRSKIAEDEMIEQTLKLQEARLRGVLATDSEVDAAFANFAKGNRASPSRMANELGKMGVGATHFKEFIRTQISWQRAVQGKYQTETEQISERDVVTKLRKSGSAKPEVTEYSIQQVVFIVPEQKRNSSTLSARRSEATALRQRFSNCDTTIGLAKSLRDVSVIEHRRIMEPELPTNWKDEIINAGENGTTRVKETKRGIEFIAVCNRQVVNDDKAAQVANKSSEFENFNQKGSKLAQDYLSEVRSRATIVYQ